MARFDFSTLNSSDLEELARDLLNAKEKDNKTKIVYSTFKEGKDKGIDLLYSTFQFDYAIVGQVKHYLKSGYKSLINIIKSEEIAKVKKLRPGKIYFYYFT